MFVAPAIWADEVAKVHTELTERGLIDEQTSEDRKSILATAQATISRSNLSKPLWDTLLDTLPTAKAVFGNEIESELNELWKIRSKVIASAQSYARLANQSKPRDEKELESQIKRQGRLEGVIWSGGDIWAGKDGETVDEVGDAINHSVEQLEAVLLPIIRSDTPFGTS